MNTERVVITETQVQPRLGCSGLLLQSLLPSLAQPDLPLSRTLADPMRKLWTTGHQSNRTLQFPVPMVAVPKVYGNIPRQLRTIP